MHTLVVAADDQIEHPPIPFVHVESETEPILFFFLKLPEPIGIPAGVAIPEDARLTPSFFEKLEENGWHGIEAARAERTSVEPAAIEDTVYDIANALVRVSSVVMHHIDVDLFSMLGYGVVEAALEKGQPSLPSAAREYPDLQGKCTVVEVAVSLHLALTIQGYEVDGSDHEIYPDVDHVSDRQVREAFNYALTRVRSLQAGYHAIKKRPLTLLTEELLPPVVPYLVRNPQMIRGRVAVQPRSLLVHTALHHLIPDEELNGFQLRSLGHSETEARDNPRFRFLDLHREASAALFRYGNTRVSAIMSGIAAEEILNNLLLSMMWEEKVTPEASAASWDVALAARLKKEYAKRLGGSWDLTARNPVADWSKKVATVRNRCVHTGYTPSREEAEESISTTEALLTYLGDRLTNGRNLKRYVRTASQVLGNEGLERRGKLTKWVRGVQSSREEPQWAETFARWHRAHLRILGDTENPRRSTLEDSNVIAVIHPGRRPQWVAHNRATSQACLVRVHADEGYERSVEMLESLTEASRAHLRDGNPISVGFAPDSLTVAHASTWVEEYHLVPGAGVMVDKSDFIV